MTRPRPSAAARPTTTPISANAQPLAQHQPQHHRTVCARFPYGTFVINITACIIIGFSLTFLNPAWRFLVPVGFVGAYSTFSTFEWETFSNLQTGALLIAAVYVVLSFFLGLIGVWRGVLIARAIS
jgi:CrcB protein